VNPEEKIEELKKLLKSSSSEERRRFLYVLDYIVNYFTGNRRAPTLNEIGFHYEVSKLKEMGIVKQEKLSWRGYTYDHISIHQDIEEAIKIILEKEYYPSITEDYMREKIREVVREFMAEATEFWSEVVEFDYTEYTLLGYGKRNYKLVELGRKLSQNEVGYLIDYWTSSFSEHCKDFIFRKYPLDSRKIFIEVVEDELNRIFTTFTPAKRWCLYLKYLVPDADEKFMLSNATDRFLPNEIREAYANLPALKIQKVQGVISTLLEKEKERISRILKPIFYRDPNFISFLLMLALIGDEKERYVEVRKYQIDKAKELSPNLERQLSLYINYMKNYGLILESTYGDVLILPKIVKEALIAELRGSTDIKIFESVLDAQAFIEEEIAKATNSVKIWDPYVSAKTLRIIERVANEQVKIEVLSSLPTITEEINALAKRFNIAATIVYKKKGQRYLSPFHDRYLIIDDKIVWHFGPSLHGAGEKEYESAIHIPESSSKIFIDAFKYNFLKNKEDWRKEGYEMVKVPFE